MATFGAIASANPNVLFDPAAAMGAAQAYKRNDLMMQNAQQDQQAETFQRDATARIGLARQMADLPDDVLAKEWGPAVQRMQQAGLGQGLDPSAPPPRERLQQIASSDLTTFQKMQGEHLARQDAEQSRYHDGTLGMQQAHLNQTAAHQAASLGLQGASLAETRRHHQATLAQQERLAGGEGVALAPGSDPAAPRMVTDKNGIPVTRGLTDGQVWGVTPEGQRVAMQIPGFTPPAKPDAGAKPGATTESERKSAGFLQRMEGAEGEMRSIVQHGYDPGNIRDKVADRTPIVGNYLQSKEGQQYFTAATEWARAKLRAESGAVISDSEAANEARGYFAMPGDTPERIAQKERLRATASEAMRTMAGRSATAEAPKPAGERPPLSSFGR